MPYRTYYIGLRDGQPITAWDLRKDRVYSLVRKVMLALPETKRELSTFAVASGEFNQNPNKQPKEESNHEQPKF